MPVYLRKFYHRKLFDTKKEEQKQMDKVSNKQGHSPKTPPPPKKITSKYRR
jgi:hypothetical protein|tara:strand:- start:944 stop:1096 length:153 start_codon:yes stop_codon:yes gene_type:complete